VARPPLPIGTWGKIRTQVAKRDGSGKALAHRAQAKYRDHDGQTRPVAQRIWSSAVDNLTATTLAAASTWQTTQLLISYTGGMFDVSDLVLVPWVAQVRMARPGAVVSAPVGNGLDGALRLATLADPGAWTDLLWYDGAP
jgi:hypothetical protein